MRISDWSSDVCSSDLARPATVGATVRAIERNMRRNAGNFKEPETSRKEPERKGEAGRNRGKSGKAEAQGWRPAPPRSASGSSGMLRRTAPTEIGRAHV